MKILHNKIFQEFITIVVGLIVTFLPVPSGLTFKSMAFFGLFIWAILNWVVNVFPSFVTGILLLSLSVLFKLVKFGVAFSPFAGSTVWLIIGALALGTAVNKTGLLQRLCFSIMKVFPATFKGQALALMGAGVLIGPFMPSTVAKVSIVGGFGTRIAELLGFANRSRGMNGLFAAMYSGFCLLAPIFISSSFFAYIVLGMIPPEDAHYFNFLSWTKAMLPWGIFTFVTAYFTILFMYKPREEKLMSKEEIVKMSDALGPMSKAEKQTMCILILCLICWILERIINVPAVLPALFGMCALFACKILTPKDINTSINWGIIIFVASVIALAPMVSVVGINKWIGISLVPILSGISANPYTFVAIVAVLALLSRFIFVGGSSSISLFTVMLIPFCQAAGMNCWIGGIVAYVMAQPFFFKYQNANFVIGFVSAGNDEKISYPSLIKYAVAYHCLAITGLLLSVPYWQYLGLIK